MGSAEVEVVSSRLESLPPRPPTPPRETSQAVDTATSTKRFLILPPSSDPRSALHTPPSVHSPVSGADSTNPSSVRRARKRVGFSAKADYNEAPDYPVINAPNKRTPLSARSSAQPRPAKGILKQTSSPSPLVAATKADTLVTPASISDMLESTVKQLAGADRDSKRDAYTTLFNTLKTSSNLPDRIALQSKMGLFVQFIQRDMTSKSPTTGGLDVPLVNNALTLLTTFLHFPAIASTIPSDFGIFFIDHCIRSFEDSSTPKDVARYLMHAVATQDFPPKVMSSDRVRRLITALRKIDEHLKGKSIALSRILIYKRLVQQTRQIMAVHSEWLHDLLTEMLSTIRDLRSAAISLGFEAVYTFGKEKSLSRKVMEIFDTSIEEMKFAEYYHRQLDAMAKNKDDKELTAAVPRIWSIIILFLRCPLERWQFINQWLLLIQTCFNNSNHTQTKQEANFAWNRFVWSMHTEGQSFVKLLPTLYKPLGSQLKAKQISKNMREVVFGSVCNLLYYTFRPGTNTALLETYWEACVKPLTEPPKAAARNSDVIDEHMRQATLVLIGLFDSSTPRIWREERIREPTPIQPKELPAIDPKWLRHNAANVFQIIDPIMERHFLGLADKESHIHRLWRTLVGAVVSAASKEIKVSVDTAAFVSQMLGLLLKHWEIGLGEMEQPDSETAARFLGSARELITVTVEALGVLPFTEKMICMSRLHTFTPVATPSHKPGKNAGDTRTPLHHLFGLVSRLPPGIPDNEEFVDFFRAIFTPFLASKSAKVRSDLAQEMLLVSPSWSSPAGRAPYAFWVFASECLSATLDRPQNGAQATSSTGEPGLGHEYRAVVRLLERGWKETPNLPWQHWCSLFSLLSNKSSEETGEAGRALVAIEPLAKVIRDTLPTEQTAPVPSKAVVGATELLSVATHPLDRQAVEAARRRLWGTASTGPRSPSFDPFDNLYKLTSDLLERLYEAGGNGNIDDSVTAFLKKVGGFISRSSPELVSRTVANLENGLVMWIRDSQGILKTRQSPAQSEAVKFLWDTVSNVVFSATRPEEMQLDTFEELLCAAFESKHRHIVNSVAEIWNSTYESAENIQYPEHLKTVLLSAQAMVDITLPGLETVSITSTSQNRSFVESQDDIQMLTVSSTRSTRRRSQRSAASIQSSPLGAIKAPSSATRQSGSSSKKAHARARRSAPTARLRHNDSQIQFAPIAKSPLNPNADAESQVLTERQKEIRERQKDTSAMFSEMRSSPGPQHQETKAAKSKSAIEQVPETPKDVTPKSSAKYEEFVSSTPTPRRGQALAMTDNDQDMTDPPSSPPEPRPFPLLSQIKSRSSRSELDNWQFSSSPVSGSPPGEAATTTDEPTNLSLAEDAVSQQEARQVSPELTVVDDVDKSFQMGVSSASIEPELPPPAFEAASEEPVRGGSATDQNMIESALPRKPDSTPSTPQNTRVINMEEPRSGNDVFVDAPSSPQPNVLTRSASRSASRPPASKDRSFEMSDADENSLLRLVVELDRRRCNIPINDYPAESPPKMKVPRSAKKEKPAVLDCITVRGEGDDEEEEEEADEQDEPLPLTQPEPRLRKSKSHSPTKPATPQAASAASSPDKSGKKKRKRGLSNYDTRRKKRRSVDGTEEIPSSQEETSQMSPILGEANSQRSAHHGTPTRRSIGSRSDDLEAEIQSQLVSEQQEAVIRQSQSQEPTNEEKTPVSTVWEESMDVDSVAHTEVAVEEQTQKVDMLSSLGSVLANLRSAAMSRDEVYKMEDILMDIKRELFAAEKRGRA